ncbi:hypothetical protein [Bacillus sp. MRMR6]|uniref:hypothetical protein n=1 Tax=Bacillus sp. MRMR6 TaxID=1928617 RepID=UPI0009520C34|nr:hypothetical protein [Bacillus sp. MRMR6]OLS33751.1 hypothetical protein BTR25_24295 [Bacillus sp. MRMR6]
MDYFLAICKDRPNDPDGFYYTVYFINNTNTDIDELTYETGGFMTDDDEIIQTSRHSRVLGKLPAKSFREIEQDDEGSFDFVIDFTFTIKRGIKKIENKTFILNKYLRGAVKPQSPLPVINKYGYLIKSK